MESEYHIIGSIQKILSVLVGSVDQNSTVKTLCGYYTTRSSVIECYESNTYQDHVVASLLERRFTVMSPLGGFEPAANVAARQLLSGSNLSKVLEYHSHYLVIEG